MRCLQTFTAIAIVASLVAPPGEAADNVLSPGAFETQICTNDPGYWAVGCRNRLDYLDRKLNAAFREAIRVSRARAELRIQQRRWLVDVRDHITVQQTADVAIMDRVLELQDYSIRAIGRLERPMTQTEQRQICKGIADVASAGTLSDLLVVPKDLPDASLTPAEAEGAKESLTRYGSGPLKLFSLPLRHGQRFAFADFFTGGTCWSSSIFAVAPPRHGPHEPWPSEEIDDAESDDVIRWATWGGGESILVFGGRYFFVTTTMANSPGIVTWVTPIGTRRPICSLEVARVNRTVTFVREDAALCSAAVRDDLKVMKWTKDHLGSKWTDDEQKFLNDTGLPGAGIPGVGVAKLDIDNDGEIDTVGRAQYDSGAGCGSAMSRLMLLTSEGDNLQPGPMNDALMEIEDYQFETCRRLFIPGAPICPRGDSGRHAGGIQGRP